MVIRMRILLVIILIFVMRMSLMRTYLTVWYWHMEAALWLWFMITDLWRVEALWFCGCFFSMYFVDESAWCGWLAHSTCPNCTRDQTDMQTCKIVGLIGGWIFGSFSKLYAYLVAVFFHTQKKCIASIYFPKFSSNIC